MNNFRNTLQHLRRKKQADGSGKYRGGWHHLKQRNASSWQYIYIYICIFSGFMYLCVCMFAWAFLEAGKRLLNVQFRIHV